MDINIHIAQVSLSDGSNCYDVNFYDVSNGQAMLKSHFMAVTEQDAFILA